MSGFDTRTVYPNDSHEGYGALMFGYFIPPTSGNWIFYLRSDDSSRLFLNPNGSDAAGKIMIQEETACCGPFSGHASAPQALTAGQQYYIEAILKEGTGGDFCQVAAKLDTDPSNPDTLSPIPGANLAAPADPVGATLAITQQPVDATFVAQGGGAAQTVTFTAAVDASRTPIFYQWYRDNGSGFVAITGANAASYTFPPACNDNGARFRVAVYIPGATVTSSSAMLTVTALNTAPRFALTPPPAGAANSGPVSVPNVAHDIAPGSAATSVASPSIGLNFGADEPAGAGSALATSEKAGAVPQVNWNNLNGATGS